MKNFLMFAVMILGLSVAPAFAKSHTTVADGSDPMPLCHPTPQNPCKKPAVVGTVISEGKLESVNAPDGGPLPICPPRCIPYGGPNCGKCGTQHLIGENTEVNPFVL